MTPDQIKEDAIEAATEIIDEHTGFGPSVSESIARAAIDAYEAASNRHFDDAPRDGSIVLAKHFHFGWIEVRYADR